MDRIFFIRSNLHARWFWAGCIYCRILSGGGHTAWGFAALYPRLCDIDYVQGLDYKDQLMTDAFWCIYKKQQRCCKMHNFEGRFELHHGSLLMPKGIRVRSN